MTSLKTSIKTITYLSDIGCLEIQGASLVPNRISNVISIPLIIPSTSCNFPTLELHIVQTPDAKKSHVHF
ncbi:hypothetical protein D8Y29_10945 [Escherichia coli]|nr:hypothetical protein D8Y29_10945 [Escherichia coli]